MNSNLPKFAMVMTSDDTDVKRANRELRQDLASTAQAASATAPAFDRQADATEKVTRAAQELARSTVVAAAEMERLKSKFDPLYAAEQRHRTAIEEINKAQELGSISASRAIDLRLRETNSLNGLISKLDQVAVARKRAAEGAVASITVTPDRGADIEAYGRQLDGMRSKFNPVFATLTQYKAQLAEIREAHKVGAISADEMAAAISRQRQAALATVAAIKGRESGSGAGDRFRLQNLGYQAFDVGQGLFGGMPLPLIAAQQGPQIAQMYAGQGGTSAFLKDIQALAGGAAKAITPLTVGIVGLTAVVASGAIAYNGYLKSTKEVETAAAGLGRATAGTTSALEAAAQAGAASAGISVSAARSMEAQFLRTGKIGSENFEQLISLSKDFGATVGLDAEAAGAALSEMFADPAKAAQTLYQQYGLIDAATARQAINLAKQNRQSEAQAVLLKALPGQLVNASEATTALGRAWDWVGRMASNAGDAIGGAIDRAIEGPSLEERIAKLRAQTSISGSGWMGRGNSPERREELAALESEKEIRDYDEAVAKRQAERIRRSQAATEAATGSGANASAIREQSLRNEIAAIQNGHDGLTGEDARQADAALAAKERVLDALINKQQRLSELDRLDIQIQNERNPLLRADLEARRAALSLADQEVEGVEATNAAARARNRVIEETISGAQRQAQDMQAELETRIRLNTLVASGAVTSEDANRMLQEELTLRPLIAAAATAEGEAKDRLNKVIEDMRSGYEGLAQQQKLAAAQDYLKSGNERIEQLRVEQALIGANDTVRAQALARLQAEQEIRRRGIDANGDLAKQIRDQAAATSELNSQIEKQAEAWRKVQDAAEGAIDGAVDKLADGDFKGALDEIKNAFLDFAKDDIKANLKNALLGTDYGTSADVGGIGGIISRLFGGNRADPASIVSKAMGQSVGAMNVNAATVNINGGIGGLGSSLLGGVANDNAAGGFSGLGKLIPVTRSALPDLSGETGDVASYITQAALKRGIDPNIALAVAKSEGGLKSWNLQSSVFKNGVQEPSFGPYQLYMGGGLGNKFMSQTGLDPRVAANGPAGVDFALDYASKNGWGSWYGAAKAGIGKFDGIGGNGAADAVNKLATATNEATIKLGTMNSGVGVAAEGLGSLGSGFSQFGQNLTSYFPPAPAGGGGSGGGGGLFSWLGGLFGGGSQWSQAASGSIVGLFDSGGPTGGSDPKRVAGLVHEKEYVFDAQATEAIGVGNLEALRRTARSGGKRGYDTGGYVSSISPVYARTSAAVANQAQSAAAPGVTNVFYNNSSAHIEYQGSQQDERGNRQEIYVLSDATGKALATPGSGAQRTMNQVYGAKPRGTVR